MNEDCSPIPRSCAKCKKPVTYVYTKTRPPSLTVTKRETIIYICEDHAREIMKDWGDW